MQSRVRDRDAVAILPQRGNGFRRLNACRVPGLNVQGA